VKVLFKAYCQGILDRPAVEETLGIGKARFFALLKHYRQNPEGFCLIHQRTAPARLPARAEEEIESELMLEKGLIDDPTLPITTYNYSAIRDRLAKRGVIVSLPTIITRAQSLGCYQPHPRKKGHDREVVTTAIGALIQHDASHHRWSPYATLTGKSYRALLRPDKSLEKEVVTVSYCDTILKSAPRVVDYLEKQGGNLT